MLYLRADDLKCILAALNKHDETEAHAALHRLILEFKYVQEKLKDAEAEIEAFIPSIRGA